MEQDLTAALVLIVSLGVGAQWLAWRTRLPAIVLLASAGILIGPVAASLGFFHLDPTATFGSALKPVVSLCVAIILFEGGLNLHFSELKAAATGVRRLVYLGAPIAWALGSLAAHFIGGLTWPVSLLFGAIMVVTGPTVIMPLLRQAALNRRTASYFKWEGIINDPIGALLAVLVFQFFLFAQAGSGWEVVMAGIGKALASALLLGVGGGYFAGKAFHAGLVPEYLKSPVMLGLVLLVYSVSNFLQHEAGLLAVTFMGIVIGNMNLAGIQDMKRFKEYITVMLVSVVFVLLTADLDVEVIRNIDWHGGALVAAVLFLVRPATIMLATIGSKMLMADRILLSWIAPRGIVAAATAGVFGPRLADEGFAGADALLALVFAVIFATVLLHGLSIGWLSRKLGLAAKNRNGVLLVGASPWTTDLARTLKELNVPVLVVDSSWHNLRQARLAGLPVFYGEILSDFADESVETAHIGTLLAATSNDAYNALVCTALAPELGRQNVYQLPMGAANEDDPRGVARSLRGKIAISNEALYERLWRSQARGWGFYKTRLTETYSYSDLLGDAPSDAQQILVLDADGSVRFISPQAQFEPLAGATVVYFGPERPAEKTETDTADDSGSPAPSTAPA
ncbi:MAG: sodium:proton antiporter [Gammaproteobacteria bacterium]|nr:sodium:proton antiporter [Gammaproteobacteria bacterium]